jgi:hypothetical protein
MPRGVVLVVLVLLAVAGMEHQLSDGEPHPLGRRAPELWAPAHHAPSSPAPGQCALVIPLQPGGTFTLTSPEDGVLFDLDTDGHAERVSWTQRGADVAWLAVDRDGDGRITSGRELIGDRLMPRARTAPDALIAFGNQGRARETRAALDSDDSAFLELVLWRDVDHDGVSQPSELRSARHVLADIGLAFKQHHRRDVHGNESRHLGFAHVRTAPGVNRVATPGDNVGRLRWVYDACLIAR